MLLTFSSSSTHSNHFGLPICSPPKMGFDTRNPLFPSRRNSAFVAWTDCLKTSGTVVKFAAKALAMLGERWLEWTIGDYKRSQKDTLKLAGRSIAILQLGLPTSVPCSEDVNLVRHWHRGIGSEIVERIWCRLAHKLLLSDNSPASALDVLHDAFSPYYSKLTDYSD